MKSFTWAVFATRIIELLKGDVRAFITYLPVACGIHDPGNQEGENQKTKQPNTQSSVLDGTREKKDDGDQAYIFKFEVTYMCDCNVGPFPTNTMDCLLAVVESHEQ